MAALRLKHGDEYDTRIYNYSSQIYSKELYLLAYLEPFCAAPLELEWSVAGEYLEMQVLTPDFDPKFRRTKAKSVKGELEASRLLSPINVAGQRDLKDDSCSSGHS
ncbi:hypothetical protein CQW23_01127 [Capsicum baccatum]|uniref:Uncharacterized protein n=1 Tax=Capsicum baccatum TaxID=33114 RepID=A0A2G2XMP6_CAPBA|nr:hypothetical protein CQW23_01127 [Capsicum baccatum]